MKLSNKQQQRHLWLSQQLRANTQDYITQELYRQELHYIEVEYAYRPRYSEVELRPRCSNPKKHTRKHTR